MNLIKITLPTMIRLGPLHPQPNPWLHLHHHHDVFSLIALDLNAVIMEFDSKTCFFFYYPDDYNKQENPFDPLMKCILLDGIIPLALTYFASFFLAHGIAHQVFCQHYTDLKKEQLKKFA